MNEIAEKLKKSLLSSRAMHGYLFTGSGCGAENGIIEECACILLFGRVDIERLRSVPDYIELDGNAKVDRIREIKSELSKRTFSTDSRVVVIRNAHLLNDSANNAMLKMLEEPPDGTYFLLTGVELRILPTIRSRVLTVRLGEHSPKEITQALLKAGAAAAQAERLCRESGGALDIAAQLMREPEFSKLRKAAISALFTALKGGSLFTSSDMLGSDAASAHASLYFMLSACHDILLIKSGCHSQDAFNADFASETAAVAESLKFEDIRRITAAISSAAERISPIIRLSRVFDMLMTELAYNG